MIDNPLLVYCKTAKGHAEISGRHHGLLSRQRSALILMDCAKTIGFIAIAIPLAELEKIVPFLMQNGFIVLADTHREHATQLSAINKPALTNGIKPAQARPAFTQDPEVIAKVKHFMITTANSYLGLMSTEIISRIQRCHTAEQLMAAVALWHMALRESKICTGFAADFLDQVKFELQSDN